MASGSVGRGACSPGQLLAQREDARFAIAQVRRQLIQSLADLVDALRGARLVVVGVADEGARLGGLQLDLQRGKPVLDGRVGLGGDAGIAPIALQRRRRRCCPSSAIGSTRASAFWAASRLARAAASSLAISAPRAVSCRSRPSWKERS